MIIIKRSIIQEKIIIIEQIIITEVKNIKGIQKIVFLIKMKKKNQFIKENMKITWIMEISNKEVIRISQKYMRKKREMKDLKENLNINTEQIINVD